MDNPVLVEVMRGGLVESRHRGAVAVVDADGDRRAGARRRRAAGLSALGRQGAAGAAAGRNRARRTASASATRNWRWPARPTAASPAMSRPRSAMLARAGLDARRARMRRALADAPSRRRRRWRAPGASRRRCTTTARASTRAFCAPPARLGGRPARLRASPSIRCSARCKATLESTQRRRLLRRRAAPSTAARCRPGRCRCTAWRCAFARFGTGHGLAPERAQAAARLRAACAAHPGIVAGTGRFCTEMMRLFGARVFVKTGAEGVFCGALPERASASRSNATTGRRAPPRSSWRR